MKKGKAMLFDTAKTKRHLSKKAHETHSDFEIFNVCHSNLCDVRVSNIQKKENLMKNYKTIYTQALNECICLEEMKHIGIKPFKG